jgi:hypothetical protein
MIQVKCSCYFLKAFSGIAGDHQIDVPDIQGIRIHGQNVRQIHLLQPAFPDRNAVRFDKEAKRICETPPYI